MYIGQIPDFNFQEVSYPLTKEGIKAYYAYINALSMDVKKRQPNIDALKMSDLINTYGFTYEEASALNYVDIGDDIFNIKSKDRVVPFVGNEPIVGSPIRTEVTGQAAGGNAGLAIAAALSALTFLG